MNSFKDSVFHILMLIISIRLEIIYCQQQTSSNNSTFNNTNINRSYSIFKETDEYIIFYRNHTIEELEKEYLSNNKTIYTSCGIAYCKYKQGICVSELNSICRCEDKYTSFPNNNFFQCTYVKKLQIISFCLELILMCGLGHFYMGNTVFGVVKMSLFLTECIIIIILRYYDRDKEELNSTSLNIAFFGCIIFSFFIVWYLFDIIWIILNKYKDSNGIDLYPFLIA